MSTPKKVLGITFGDPCGIGPEVTQKALASEEVAALDCEFRLFGDQNLDAFPLGSPSEASGAHAYEALQAAAKAANEGSIDALVTAPISKEWAQKAGFSWPGQTEFIAEQQGVDNFAMCLTGASLTVVLMTIHVAIADVPDLLSESDIIRVGKLAAKFAEKTSERKRPKIAVCGLNPHAGENGAMGREEMEMISPAIQKLQATYPDAEFSGPHVPDVIFRYAAQGDYDAVVVMYHDQGLIPLKLLDFDRGVNVTLGLNCPRTSPDHGTAFDIAGQSIASEHSMIEAIKLAHRMA